MSGALAPGDRLPSTRSLAASLGVSRGTVVEAFDQLRAEGFLDAKVGAGTRVASALKDEPIASIEAWIAILELAGGVAAAGVGDPLVVAETIRAIDESIDTIEPGEVGVVPEMADMGRGQHGEGFDR